MTTPATHPDQEPHCVTELGSPDPTGTLTIRFKGGDFMRCRKAPVSTLTELHAHLDRHGFTGWRVLVLNNQSIALNMAEVAAFRFDASPDRGKQ